MKYGLQPPLIRDELPPNEQQKDDVVEMFLDAVRYDLNEIFLTYYEVFERENRNRPTALKEAKYELAGKGVRIVGGGRFRRFTIKDPRHRIVLRALIKLQKRGLTARDMHSDGTFFERDANAKPRITRVDQVTLIEIMKLRKQDE